MSDALEAALALLPAWVPYAPLAIVPYQMLAAAALMQPVMRWLGGDIPDDVRWPERARLGFERRRGLLTSALSLGLLGGILAGLYVGPMGVGSAWSLGLLCGGGALLVALRPLRRIEANALGRDPGWGARLRSAATSLLVRMGHLLLLLALALLLPWQVGWPHALGAALYAVVTMAWYRGAGVQLAARLGLAPPSEPRVRRLAEQAAARAGVTLRGCRTLEMLSANAFALPHTGEMGVTRAAAALLSDAELEAIFDHEAGHLAEPARVRAMREAVGLALAPVVLAKPAVGAWWLFGLLGVLLFAYAVLWLGQRLILRMEHEADAHAHGGDAEAYARALESLYRYNGVPPVLGGRRSHPDLYDRMLAAGVQPDYPRPEPPRRSRGKALDVALLVVGTLVFVAPRVALHAAEDPTRGAGLFLRALRGGDEAFLLHLAGAAEDPAERLTFTRAAVEVTGGAGWVRLILVEELLAQGACSEATLAWRALADDGWTPGPWDEEPAEAIEASIAACGGHGSPGTLR